MRERERERRHGAVLTICRAMRSHPRSPTLVCHPTNSLSAGRVTREESSTCVDTTGPARARVSRGGRIRARKIIIILTGRAGAAIFLASKNRNTYLSFLPINSATRLFEIGRRIVTRGGGGERRWIEWSLNRFNRRS